MKVLATGEKLAILKYTARGVQGFLIDSMVLFLQLYNPTIQVYYSTSISYHQGIQWNANWFSRMPKRHWESKFNQRLFLQQIAETFQIEKPSDWGKVTIKQMMQAGSSSVLTHYDFNVMKMLQNVFPGSLI